MLIALVHGVLKFTGQLIELMSVVAYFILPFLVGFFLPALLHVALLLRWLVPLPAKLHGSDRKHSQGGNERESIDGFVEHKDLSSAPLSGAAIRHRELLDADTRQFVASDKLAECSDYK